MPVHQTALLRILQLMPNVHCVIPHVPPVSQLTRPTVLPVTLDTSSSPLPAIPHVLLAPILTQQAPAHLALLHATPAQVAQTPALDVSMEASYSVTPAILPVLQHTSKTTVLANYVSRNVSHAHMVLLISALPAPLRSSSTIRSPMPARLHAQFHIILLLVVLRSVNPAACLANHA